MSVQAKHGGPLSEEEFRKFTLYMNGSNNREDDQERARILGFSAANVRVAPGAVIRVSDSDSIHHDVYIGLYSYINGDVTLHPRVLVGPQVSIVASNHRYSAEDDYFSARTDPEQGKVVIEHGVWLTTGVVVTPGCTIGRCSLVCANSVVTEDVPPYTIVAGSPARKIGEIDRHTGDYRWMRED